MSLFNRLPGSKRSPSGLEWTVLKKLPALLIIGTIVLGGFALLMHWNMFDLDAKQALKAQYVTIGLIFFHWMSTLTTAIFCMIVVLMKGHAYVWDAYPLPDSERPHQQ